LSVSDHEESGASRGNRRGNIHRRKRGHREIHPVVADESQVAAGEQPEAVTSLRLAVVNQSVDGDGCSLGEAAADMSRRQHPDVLGRRVVAQINAGGVRVADHIVISGEGNPVFALKLRFRRVVRRVSAAAGSRHDHGGRGGKDKADVV